jgi:hypothetical protein
MLTDIQCRFTGGFYVWRGTIYACQSPSWHLGDEQRGVTDTPKPEESSLLLLGSAFSATSTAGHVDLLYEAATF